MIGIMNQDYRTKARRFRILIEDHDLELLLEHRTATYGELYAPGVDLSIAFLKLSMGKGRLSIADDWYDLTAPEHILAYLTTHKRIRDTRTRSEYVREDLVRGIGRPRVLATGSSNTIF